MDRHYLRETLQLATNSATGGGGPFGAAVFSEQEKFFGTNAVTANNDPTAHAEIQAIRAAGASRGFDLTGAVLYSSCQPCPMCMAAALWARLDRVVWAASAEQAAAAGFDDSLFWQQIRGGVEIIPVGRSDEVSEAEANGPFEAWDDFAGKVPY